MSAIFLDSRKLRKKILETAGEALTQFPQIAQIRLFGSLAKGDENPFSDVDIIVVLTAKDDSADPFRIAKPYFAFFSDHLRIAVDVLVTDLGRVEQLDKTVGGSLVIAERARA